MQTYDSTVQFKHNEKEYEAYCSVTIHHEPKEGMDIDGNRGQPRDFVEDFSILELYNITNKESMDLYAPEVQAFIDEVNEDILEKLEEQLSEAEDSIPN